MQRISLIGIVILLLSPFSVSWAQAPEWSKGLVWYQIFPERFRNGDLTNEPNKERARGLKDGPLVRGRPIGMIERSGNSKRPPIFMISFENAGMEGSSRGY